MSARVGLGPQRLSGMTSCLHGVFIDGDTGYILFTNINVRMGNIAVMISVYIVTL